MKRNENVASRLSLLLVDDPHFPNLCRPAEVEWTRGASNVEATQTGDTIQGSITYVTKTNGNPDCAAVECSASQRLGGSRPPK